MNFKSILTSSASILIFAGAAQAADVIVLDPEPVEYIRICDAYGEGFFYIPGTETCLKFSGYVRVTYRVNEYHDGDPRLDDSDLNPGNGLQPIYDTHRHRIRYRGRFNVDTRNETEWGTLRSQLRFQGGDYGAGFSSDDNFSDGDASSHGSGDASVALDRALISLAGFRLGYSSDYWTTISDSGYYLAINDGYYGDSQATFLDYTHASNGFTFTAGLQVASSASGGVVNGTGIAGQPDFYVGGDYAGTWGRIYGTYYKDSSQDKSAYKVGVHLSLTEFIPGGSIGSWFMADDGDTDYVHGHAWGITAKMNLSDKWRIYGGYTDWDRTDGNVDGIDQANWTLGAQWKITPGLDTKFEYSKTNYQGLYGTGQYAVRVTRSF